MSDHGRDVASEARATLDAWHERGADRLDPVRFHFIEALERRTAGHSGEARRILDERLSALLETYADNLEGAALATEESTVPADSAESAALSTDEPATATLAGLLDYMASRAHDVPAANGLPRAASYPELAALDDFRQMWSKVRAEKQMRQSLEQVPGNTGPLNSSSLVHRALSLMSELSPGYLTQFLGYVDALSWLDQMNGGAAPTGKDAPRAVSAGRSARGKAR
ncbi:hypothetical protein A6V36_34880 [Paraburkholderia ginsengiterrae]|uniref:DUF2894 domain-containing protein n=1 Tax=Paraburkholderia ginsengiterrae TaxID=1462993 RepID=A0A1A9N0A6_9BURK|nr:DUF2894 domain-containing protein [Paraburkholderia ginsengiterrae]OAJ54752.1 hypothetical protein A6V37_34000 [Paraburkholderia ginsengiterrae]OAJ55523.1 hypothetical protein A6V36_34880 [Paraburkholderia ginsengiterrae]